MERKRKASPPPVRPAPPFRRVETVGANDDLVRIIFGHFLTPRRTLAWEKEADGRLSSRRCYLDLTPAQQRLQSYQTLRLVCRRWARIVGGLVRRLMAPLVYREGAIALDVAFPRVCVISTGTQMVASVHDQFEEVLLAYARLGTPVSVIDARGCCHPAMRDINMHGALFIDGRNGANCTRGRFRNPAFWPRAWPRWSDPRRLHVQVDYNDWPACVGAALVRAYSVEFSCYRVRTVSDVLYRAKEIWFHIPTFVHTTCLGAQHPLDAIKELFQPAKWADGQLPAVFFLIYASLGNEGLYIDMIEKAMALLPPGCATIYAQEERLYASCGVPAFNTRFLPT